ncbi:MAG: phenylalanine--tRNA ligase subunit beta [Christensenellaceae bacterium]
MLAPYRWICDYAKINSDVKTLADKMVMTGNGVENIEFLGDNIVNVVVGKIEKLEKHPDADKLQICGIDVGDAELLQIVTGADNVFVGAYVPVAKAVATLPNGIIKKGKLRGVESFGMLCSGEELNLKEEDYEGAGVDGIMILQGEPQVGMDVCELLGLRGAVIEFEVGANRPDCLSMMGVAREAAAIENVAFLTPDINYTTSEKKIEDFVSVDVQAPDLCTRYIAAAITDVKIERSPAWMRTRLREAGIRPINNIVDITNFVMLETGQPMHAFDAQNIGGKKIVVRRAKNGEKMTTLDEKEREFNDSMLLICDENSALGVAGVMGGLDSEIKNNTQAVVFECAKFRYGNIRQTSRSLGLATESSMRFSKGVDAGMTLFAMKRALALVQQLGAGKAAQGMIDVLNEDLAPKIITTTAQRINSLLGIEISAKEMQTLLNRVFIDTKVMGDELVCTIPSFRADIFGSADIAEEVARMYGYDNIASSIPRVEMRRGVISKNESNTDTIKKYLADLGFLECITYSFIGAQDYAKIGIEMPKCVKIINPLGDDTAYMRTTLVAHMMNTVAINLNRKNDDLQLFECARVYIPQEAQPLPNEIPMLCMALSGEGKDFYTAKGMIENMVSLISGETIECKRTEKPFLHPGICADIYVKEQNIGFIGQLHPQIMKNFDVDQNVILVQLDLQKLFAIQKPQVKFTQLPKFPAATRDIAVIVDEEVGAGDMSIDMKAAGGKRVEKVELFDVFTGEKIGMGKKSIAYAITMRSSEGTMVDKEADAIMAKILKTLEIKYGAKLRD